MSKQTKRGPGGLKVIFDDNDSDTPVIVALGNGTATFHCCEGEGEVEGQELSDAQVSFLRNIAQEAYDFYDAHTGCRG